MKAGKFIFSVDFVVLDFKEDENIPLILGIPFLYTSKAIIDVYDGTLTLRVGDESCKFDVYQGMMYPSKIDFCMIVNLVDDYMNKVQRGKLEKSCHSEDIEKCLQVHSSKEAWILKH